jgi:hypothetical protein
VAGISYVSEASTASDIPSTASVSVVFGVYMLFTSLLLLASLLLLKFHFHRIWAVLLFYASPNVQILSCVAVGPAVAQQGMPEITGMPATAGMPVAAVMSALQEKITQQHGCQQQYVQLEHAEMPAAAGTRTTRTSASAVRPQPPEFQQQGFQHQDQQGMSAWKASNSINVRSSVEHQQQQFHHVHQLLQAGKKQGCQSINGASTNQKASEDASNSMDASNNRDASNSRDTINSRGDRSKDASKGRDFIKDRKGSYIHDPSNIRATTGCQQ